MTELFADTVFGHLVRFVSRGRYWAWEEQRDSAVAEQYLAGRKGRSVNDKQNRQLRNARSTSALSEGAESAQSATHAAAYGGEKGGAENLVEWMENDAKVRRRVRLGILVKRCLIDLEPDELAQDEEVLRDLPDLPSDDVGLHWLFHLHFGHPRHHRAVSS